MRAAAALASLADVATSPAETGTPWRSRISFDPYSWSFTASPPGLNGRGPLQPTLAVPTAGAVTGAHRSTTRSDLHRHPDPRRWDRPRAQRGDRRRAGGDRDPLRLG